jgi:uncharacterized membrane protein
MPINENQLQFENALTEMVPQAGVIFLGESILSTILYAAMIYRIDNLVCGRKDNFGEALLVGIKKIPVSFFAMVLYLIAVLLGTLLLVIPGIFLSLSLAFFMYFIVIENHSAYSAVKASNRLVSGNWWRTMVIYMTPSIILLIIIIVGIALVEIIIPTAGIMSETYFNLGEIIANLLVGALIPLFYVIGFVQYRDLKLRRSGDDLDARMS